MDPSNISIRDISRFSVLLVGTGFAVHIIELQFYLEPAHLILGGLIIGCIEMFISNYMKLSAVNNRGNEAPEAESEANVYIVDSLNQLNEREGLDWAAELNNGENDDS